MELLSPQIEEEAAIEKIVNKFFYSIQVAWKNQDLANVKKYYSNDLFQLHIDKIDEMKRHNERNIIEDLTLCKVGNLYWFEQNVNFNVELEARALYRIK